TSAERFIAAVIDRLSRRHPRVVSYVVPAGADTLHRELNERSLDLVIARGGGFFKDEQFGLDILYHDSFVILAGAQSPWARRRRIDLADLVNEPWALPPPDNVVSAAAMEAFRVSGLDYPRATLVTVSPELRINLVATGRFLTIAASPFRTKHPELKVLSVELPMARMPVGIVTLKARTLSPVARLFIQQAHEVVKLLAREKGRRSAHEAI